MFNLRFVLFLFFIHMVLIGQELIEKPPVDSLAISKWSSDGFSYADLGTQEQHSYFSVLFELDPKFYAELQGFYNSHRISDVLDLSTRVKWYPVKKVYLFSGVGIQVDRTKGFGGLPIMPTRMFKGVGYEPNKSIKIEAVYDLNFNTTNAEFNATPSLFTLKGKYRF